MIHEFALEPDALSNWDTIRYFFAHFGFENGRLISQFPKKWKSLVYHACSECKDIEKKRIEETLAKSDHKFIRNGRPYDSTIAWLMNAEIQHARIPFRAIIARENPRNHDGIILAEIITDDTPLWNVETGICVARKSADIATCLEPMLRVSEEILLVDPHFRPGEIRYRRILQELTRIMATNPRLKRVEYHLNDTLGKENFISECTSKVRSILPCDMEVKFIRWKQRENGEKLHARYVLTEYGGISIEVGLDEGNDGETTDIKILSDEIYKKRWTSFQKNSDTYEYVDEFPLKGILKL